MDPRESGDDSQLMRKSCLILYTWKNKHIRKRIICFRKGLATEIPYVFIYAREYNYRTDDIHMTNKKVENKLLKIFLSLYVFLRSLL